MQLVGRPTGWQGALPLIIVGFLFGYVVLPSKSFPSTNCSGSPACTTPLAHLTMISSSPSRLLSAAFLWPSGPGLGIGGGVVERPSRYTAEVSGKVGPFPAQVHLRFSCTDIMAPPGGITDRQPYIVDVPECVAILCRSGLNWGMTEPGFHFLCVAAANYAPPPLGMASPNSRLPQTLPPDGRTGARYTAA